MHTPRLFSIALLSSFMAFAGAGCGDDAASTTDAGARLDGAAAGDGQAPGADATTGTGDAAAPGDTATMATDATGGGVDAPAAGDATGGGPDVPVSPGDGATGTTDMAAATPDTASTAADAGGDAGGACGNINCPALFALASQCTTMGACTSQVSASGVNLCYANGVKVLTTIMLSPPNYTGTTRFVKPDGTTCFTIESTGMGSGMMTTSTYKDPGGNVLATGTTTGNQTTLTCGGSTYDTTNLNCPGSTTSGGCTQGTCM
jgi:hypothetical protein